MPKLSHKQLYDKMPLKLKDRIQAQCEELIAEVLPSKKSIELIESVKHWVAEAIAMMDDGNIGELRIYGSAASGLSMKGSSDIDFTLDYTGTRSYSNVLR